MAGLGNDHTSPGGEANHTTSRMGTCPQNLLWLLCGSGRGTPKTPLQPTISGRPVRPGTVCMVITYSKGKDQPGKVANPARGQLNRENQYFRVPVRA